MDTSSLAPALDSTDTSAGGRVAWGRVALFYSIALGMVSLLGAFFALRGARFETGAAAVIYTYVLAFLYMPMPLVAGLVVERVAGRTLLLRKTWTQFRAQWKRVIAVSAATALGVYALNLGLTFLLGNMLSLPGVGHIVFTTQGLLANLSQFVPKASLDELASMPSVGVLIIIGGVSGVVAGFTINGLFAFGEEYGWRGVLADELRPLGTVRASVLTGVMWGLWHAPIILLGFNYGQYRFAGLAMMCAWVIPLSLLMWRTRQFTDSVLPSAVIHGAFNGSAGFFLFFVADRHPLVGSPVGITGALSIAIATAAVWWFTRAGVSEQRRVPGSFAAD